MFEIQEEVSSFYLYFFLIIVNIIKRISWLKGWNDSKCINFNDMFDSWKWVSVNEKKNKNKK